MTRLLLTTDPGGLREVRAADRLLLDLARELPLPEGTFGCTHLVRDGRPRVVVSLTLESAEVAEAVRAVLAGRGHTVTDGVPDAVGRAVLYPGYAELTGTVTVGELLTRSAVQRVEVLGAPGTPDPETPLVTREFVRPMWRDGTLVLSAMPAANGTLVPFEFPNPTPCCADH